MEFPANGTVRGSGMCSLRKSSVWRPGVRQGEGRGGDGGEEPRSGVHGGDEVVHLGQLGRRGVDHQVGALGHDVQFVVGHQTGDLDDGVPGGIESGHLEIHPGQHGRACYRALGPGAGLRSARPVMSGDAPCARFTGSTRSWHCPPTPGPAMPGRTCASRRRGAGRRGRSRPRADRARDGHPEGHAGLVQPRSGLALRHGVTCLNTPGLIDAGYRGELQVLLVNHDPVDDYAVGRGDRIAQLVIVRVEEATFDPVPAEGSGRGHAAVRAGFGHTGT